MTDILSILKCPVCGGKLERISGSIVCTEGHSFDVAKSGYVNLLPPGKERNAKTGDEKTMVRARADFLALGLYDRISSTAAELVEENTDGDLVAVDMGCGEGHHTVNFASVLGRNRNILTLGFDASKYATDLASRYSLRCGYLPRGGFGEAFPSDVQAYFAAGNLFSLPVVSGSADAALSMFAPVAAAETARILKHGGILCVVASGRNHLREMRETIYSDVHYNDDEIKIPEGFKPVARKTLEYEIELSQKSISDLFVMTPFYYKTTAEGRERLLSLEYLKVTVNTDYLIAEAIQ